MAGVLCGDEMAVCVPLGMGCGKIVRREAGEDSASAAAMLRRGGDTSPLRGSPAASSAHARSCSAVAGHGWPAPSAASARKSPTATVARRERACDLGTVWGANSVLLGERCILGVVKGEVMSTDPLDRSLGEDGSAGGTAALCRPGEASPGVTRTTLRVLSLGLACSELRRGLCDRACSSRGASGSRAGRGCGDSTVVCLLLRIGVGTRSMLPTAPAPAG